MAIIWMFILFITIGLIWRGAEKILYKKANPNPIDDVVAAILAISLYFNFLVRRMTNWKLMQSLIINMIRVI
ncbi:hypothetical protein GCM10008931_43820 [Oceanobacillus oncorhynchi subsp. oncorhynchi]